MIQSNLEIFKDTRSIENNFRDVLDQIYIILKKFEVPIKPYKSNALNDYSAMNMESKKTALRDASTYLEVLMSDLEREEDSKHSEGQSLWLALRYFGLRPTSDVFEVLTNEDAIELYSIDGIQLWRNFKFMEVCSYTLEEIFCYTWQQRYERDENAIKEVTEALSFLTFDNPKTIKCSIKNLIVEKFSEKKLAIDVFHEHLSPVFDYTNRLAGFIVASKVKIIQN